MTREELLAVLNDCVRDLEAGHINADFALLEYINDADIIATYLRVFRRYS